MDTLSILRVSLDALHLDPANARQHGERNLEAIRASLASFGQVVPLVVSAEPKPGSYPSEGLATAPVPSHRNKGSSKSLIIPRITNGTSTMRSAISTRPRAACVWADSRKGTSPSPHAVQNLARSSSTILAPQTGQ